MHPEVEQTILEYCRKGSAPVDQELIDGNLLLKIWGKAQRLIDDANSTGGCSDEEETNAYYELDEVSKHVQKSRIGWTFRKVVVDEMLVEIGRDNSGFTDQLADGAEELCKSPEERRYFAERLALCGSRYYQNEAASILWKLGDCGKSLAIRKSNLVYGEDYLDLAVCQDELGEYAAALEIALDGLRRGAGRLDGLYRYLFDRFEKAEDDAAIQSLFDAALKERRDQDCIAELMYERFSRKGDAAGRKAMLRLLMATCDDESARKWYEQCRQEFSQEEWRKDEGDLLQSVKKKSLTVYLDICLDQGNRKAALDCIVREKEEHVWSTVDTGHRYSRLLVKDFPEEILELYWREVHSLIRRSSDAQYRSAAATLKEIKTILVKRGLADDWQRLFGELKDANRRRKNFQREIEGL